jgi:hypothetical protein
MDNATQLVLRFFKVIVNGQAYLNLFYLLVSFPLGVFYFAYIVSGLAAGISLSIIWVGIPILLLVGVGWWVLASFERLMAIYWLKENVPAMTLPAHGGTDIWTHFKDFFTNPVTWKCPIYLLMKFPLGLATFVILVILTSLTLAFISMPLTYEFLPGFQVGVFFDSSRPPWRIDSMSDALLGALIGLVLWPVTLHLTNGLAWVHAKFARVMLSINFYALIGSTAAV